MSSRYIIARLRKPLNSNVVESDVMSIDCRTCANFVGLGSPCRSTARCTEGDQYKPTPKIQIWSDV